LIADKPACGRWGVIIAPPATIYLWYKYKKICVDAQGDAEGKEIAFFFWFRQMLLWQTQDIVFGAAFIFLYIIVKIFVLSMFKS